MVKGSRMTKGIAKVRKNQHRHTKLNMPLIIFIYQNKNSQIADFSKAFIIFTKN